MVAESAISQARYYKVSGLLPQCTFYGFTIGHFELLYNLILSSDNCIALDIAYTPIPKRRRQGREK